MPLWPFCLIIVPFGEFDFPKLILHREKVIPERSPTPSSSPSSVVQSFQMNSKQHGKAQPTKLLMGKFIFPAMLSQAALLKVQIYTILRGLEGSL